MHASTPDTPCKGVRYPLAALAGSPWAEPQPRRHGLATCRLQRRLLVWQHPRGQPWPRRADAPDDPHLWLEDVQGDTRAGLGARAQRRDAQPRSRRARLRRPCARASATCSTRGPDPVRHAARRAGSTTSGRTRPTRAACGAARRWPSTASAQPAWETRARPRRAGHGREARTGSGAAPAAWAPTTGAAWSRCRAAAPTPTVVREFDTVDEALRRRTASRCPRPRPTSTGSTPTRVYVGTDFGPGSLTDSGYPRIVKRWKRGTAAGAGARRCSKAEPSDVSALRRVDRTPASSARWSAARSTSTTREQWLLQRTASWSPIDKPERRQLRASGASTC